MVWIKRFIITAIVFVFIGLAAAAALFFTVSADLPQIITVNDYHPRLVSEVYARGGEKIGEFYREKRVLVPFDEIPEHVVRAFLAAEDDQFFEHSGINLLAMFRAFLANLKAGKSAQGGSTITQQVAKTLLLTSEKTITRKLKDILLAMQMEKNLSKQDILYLYLNQIYFGHGAYGIATAADVYFHKNVKDLSIAEAAMLAGLPQAPSRYSPVTNPKAAKERQLYVLRRMTDVKFITASVAEAEAAKSVRVNMREDYSTVAPFYVETLRQVLVQRLGESAVLDKGLKIYTGLDYEKQIAANTAIQSRLRELDKRQGFRGAAGNIQTVEGMAEFLLKNRNQLIDLATTSREIAPDGSVPLKGPLNLEKQKGPAKLPSYLKAQQIVDAVVTKVDDEAGLVYVRFAEEQGLIDIDDMTWAKPFTPEKGNEGEITKPSQAVKFGDLIKIRILAENFDGSTAQRRLSDKFKKKTKGAKIPIGSLPVLPEFKNFVQVALDQEPAVEGALISIDQKTQDIIALVGGYDFNRNQFNRALQAARQTGSLFKVFVYAAALDHGYTPATPIIDAPIVYEEKVAKEGQGSAEEIRLWKPDNHSKRFGGDILFRNALVQSLNVPTVKIVEDLGIEWPSEYARRLGVFSPLNMDFSMALGSSSVTLFEMTKAFAQIAKLGRRVRPVLVHKVVDRTKQTLLTGLSLDERFHKELQTLENGFEEKRKLYVAQKGDSTTDEPVATNVANKENKRPLDKKKLPPLYFDDPDQLMNPTTAFILTDILHAAIFESGGTGGAARSIERPAAGKTGTTSNYIDAWFIGFTPQITTGVWVGFNEEKTLGQGEVGGRAALPAWLDYMKAAHTNEPHLGFAQPDKIVFANIDKETGDIASAQSRNVVRQAFLEGTEPTREKKNTPSRKDDADFLKEELSL